MHNLIEPITKAFRSQAHCGARARGPAGAPWNEAAALQSSGRLAKIQSAVTSDAGPRFERVSSPGAFRLSEEAMEGVRLNRDDLIRAFGVSRRLAVRVGALMAQRLSVTPTLLEIAGAGSAMEEAAASPAVARTGRRALRRRRQRALPGRPAQAKKARWPWWNSPVAASWRWKEELQAEEGWQTAAAQDEPDMALARTDAGMPASPLLDRNETASLFSPEELARIKLDALAGSGVEQRISALRKLAYAPLPAREKGAVFLRVIVDPDARRPRRGHQSAGVARLQPRYRRRPADGLRRRPQTPRARLAPLGRPAWQAADRGKRHRAGGAGGALPRNAARPA